MMPKFDSPITAAAKRMTMLLETGYLDSTIASDIRTLMHGAMAYEVVTRNFPAGATGVGLGGDTQREQNPSSLSSTQRATE